MKATHEHEWEASPGLPSALPPGERVVWQGAPDWKRLAIHAFHVRKVALYFALMLAVQAINLTAPEGPVDWKPLVVAASLYALALALLSATAWMSARSTLYTLTNKRVVMRIGIVLTLTFNLPFKRIVGASLKTQGAGTGDIALALNPEDRIGWAHLWPHQRAWHVTQPQPTMRCVPDSQHVGGVLLNLWQAERAGQSLQLGDAPAATQAIPAPGMLA
ncbi:photosynthetic complex putative assembly protein PuhB [Acidovorax sp.]|uniref:photosynthetic complex putative assembly protein PuhB n=1 Tax=Acidovorax sp. TaxID=1872122 RepID=UPI00391F4847